MPNKLEERVAELEKISYLLIKELRRLPECDICKAKPKNFNELKLMNFTGACIECNRNGYAVAHDDDSQVEAFYKLEGNIMDLALKIMLSDEEREDV